MSLSSVSRTALAAIAKEIEDAINAHKRAQMDVLQTHLLEIFTAMLKQAPKGVTQAVRGELDETAVESVAYALGQVSFAQKIVAQAAQRRADDDFVDSVHMPKHRRYIEALSRQDMTNVQLAAELGISDAATVSRAMRALRSLGITDHWREGVTVINSLTPSAKAVIDASEPLAGSSEVEMTDAIKAAMTATPGYMLRSLNFAANGNSFLEEQHG